MSYFSTIANSEEFGTHASNGILPINPSRKICPSKKECPSTITRGPRHLCCLSNKNAPVSLASVRRCLNSKDNLHLNRAIHSIVYRLIFPARPRRTATKQDHHHCVNIQPESGKRHLFSVTAFLEATQLLFALAEQDTHWPIELDWD